jgi:hypothetical protein
MWNTSFISFSSSPEMSFSFASLDCRAFFGTGEDALGAERFLGGCAGMMH